MGIYSRYRIEHLLCHDSKSVSAETGAPTHHVHYYEINILGHHYSISMMHTLEG